MARQIQLSGTQGVVFVIPAFNAAAVVADAVTSALHQTRPADEVVVVDDGSSDDTAAVAAQAGAQVIRQANRGPAAARNAGIAATSADWIALLDADDVSYPNRLERSVACITDDRVAVIHGATDAPSAGGDDSTYAVRHAYSPTDPIGFESLWQRNRVITSTVLLRRQAWQEIGGFDEQRELVGVEDYNLWLRLAHAGWQFVHIGESLGEYRGTPASLTRNIPRFSAAELVNARRVAAACGLSAADLAAKEYAIYRQYACDLFHERELVNARPFLVEALRRRPLDWRLRLRLWATLLPLRSRNAA